MTVLQKLADDPDFQFLAVDRRKLVTEAPPFDGKKNVFIPDEKNGYVRAEIIGTKGDDVLCKNSENMMVSSIIIHPM